MALSQSHKILMHEGFHPAVTSQSPLDVEKSWFHHLQRRMEGQGTKYLTTAMLLLRYKSHHSDEENAEDSKHNKLARIFNTFNIGGEISDILFADGWASVLQAAMTSSSSWRAIANTAKIWDFTASVLRTDGMSGVLVAVNPEYTIGEINMAHCLDPYGFNPNNIIRQWCGEALKLEREIFLSIYLVHHRLHEKRHATGRKKGHTQMCYKHKNKYDEMKTVPIDFLSQEIVAAVKAIPKMTEIWGASQFVSSPKDQLFEQPAIFALTRMARLLLHILEQRTAIKVLYLEKIPYLDRRLIAIILRACPSLHMIGIYDCPLIHFGDVLCLIDLIHEVNRERRAAGQTQITSFDFYPKYNHGGPANVRSSATYGLTWGPQYRDIVQRGFFNIILRAYLKAKRMKLRLLFDKGKAFCKYIRKVPNVPLSVPTFLDALYRHMEAKGAAQKQATLYDLLKPVRLGLIPLPRDGDFRYYSTIAQESLMFCSSCGYETSPEFFDYHTRSLPPNDRACAACKLQQLLDEESDHLKGHQKSILTTLFPGWKATDFNEDAPLAQQGRKLMRLRTTVKIQQETRSYMTDEGFVATRPRTPAYTRHCKCHSDSLQKLPSLDDLLLGAGSDIRWFEAYNKCNNLDMYCRAVRRVSKEDPEHRLVANRFDGGMPGHVKERQAPKDIVNGLVSHDFASAVGYYYTLAAANLTAHALDEEEAQKVHDRDFW